jgi:hypothetical protein
MPVSKEYFKNYYLNHKEAFKEKSKIRVKKKFFCNCGGVYSNSSKSNHFKTLKHLNWVSSSSEKAPKISKNKLKKYQKYFELLNTSYLNDINEL